MTSRAALGAAWLALSAAAAPAAAAAALSGPSDAEVSAAYDAVQHGFFDLEDSAPPRAAEVELGRKLFFDPRLSSQGTLSCAGCHNPGLSWTDGQPRALGLRRRPLERNTPSLLNVRRNLSRDFRWDGAAAGLDDAIRNALTSRIEMRADPQAVVDALKSLPGYAREFSAVYGAEGTTLPHVIKALSAYVRADASVAGGPSAFDRFAADPSALGPAEKRGLVLFAGRGKCLLCHSGPFFSDDYYHNTGLAADPRSSDSGRYAVEPSPAFWRAFKTPPLRGVAESAPYMHDGRFRTLREVVDFYSRGGDDVQARDHLIEPLNFTDEEKDAVVAFLRALSPPRREVVPPVLPRPEEPGAALAEDVIPREAAFEYRPADLSWLNYRGGETASEARDFKFPDDGAYPRFERGELKPPKRYDADRSLSSADREKMRRALLVARRYADINAASADGYVLEEKYGKGMGVHMHNLAYELSGVLDVEKPQFLTYVRGKTGQWQLIQLGFIHRGMVRQKLFDSPNARGHFHDENICVGVREGVLRNFPGSAPCDGPGETRLGPIWMMHFAVPIYNEKGLFADDFTYADHASLTGELHTFLGAPLAVPAAASPEAELGRALFHDPRLSANRAVSCASCHNPSLGWTDGLAQARGVSLQELGVRTPSLLNVPERRLQPGSREALTSPRGLDRDAESLVRDLARLPGYLRAFKDAEGGAPDADRAARALAAFLREARSHPAALPAIPPLPDEGESAAVIAYAPAGGAPRAETPAAAGASPLDAADGAIKEAESAASVVRGDAAQARCAAATAPGRLFAELESGRLAGAALGRLPDALLELIRRERKWRALADARPAACESLAALAEARLGFAPEDAADCRSSMLDLSAARALAARDSAYPVLCRQALAAEHPELPPAEAASACRVVLDRVAEPARLCAELPAALLKGTAPEDCAAEFSRYSHPPAAPRLDRGALTETLDRLAMAASTGKASACGDDGDCRAALDRKDAAGLAAGALRQARDQACAAASRPDAAPADPEFARRRLTDARDALTRAESSRLPGDRAAAREIDARAEKLAYLEAGLAE